MKHEMTMAEFLAEVIAESRANGGPQTPSIRAEMIADGTIKYVCPDFASPGESRGAHLRLVRSSRISPPTGIGDSQ